MEVIYALWQRQIRRYYRSGSRIMGTLGQPILLLLALGYGIGAIYKRAGEGDYMQFLVPGIITQTVLLSGIFWGVIILMDKRFGFLSELLVTPVSRAKILIGSALGGATVSIMQGMLVFFISMLLGFRPYDWLLVVPAFGLLVAICLALACLGAGIASMVDDFQGFQGINNLLVMPLFFLSSALYPLNSVPTFLRIMSSYNPISYMVDALRYLLANQTHFGLEKDLIVIAVTLAACMYFAVNRFNRIQM
ncbi:multidrug ABC transporter permease [Candidatus Saccharibacteria bacterium CG_4_10_14_0_2_um_filter_52_9]|nr:MAG: multidrug ABC transporter permease [Candidatus Saccharibacteria bacterium CG_4_10_14_0_2_um_filter_52_9]